MGFLGKEEPNKPAKGRSAEKKEKGEQVRQKTGEPIPQGEPAKPALGRFWSAILGER